MYLDDDDFPEVEFSTTNVVLTLDSVQATENKVIMTSTGDFGYGGFLSISPEGMYDKDEDTD
jgi:hypothetical protein